MRILIASMVEKAKSGHPGGAMGGADFANVLFSRHLVYDPADPLWIARDRFFLDPGHMSPMLYSVLALCGRYTMEELQQFRQWGSVTPGHPELDPERGVDNASGPLGQGHVMAVGCAIAERFLVARFGEIVSHKTYAFISDGGVQEEISQGAGRLAGMLGLSNLIMYYDSNEVQLSTRVEDVSGEDTAAKYRAWGWNVLEVDGTDAEAIDSALEIAKAERLRPTLIIGHTVMARKVLKADGTSLEGAVSTHGQPLSKAGADVALTIKSMGGDPENPWQIFDDVRAMYAARQEVLRQQAAEWRDRFDAWKAENKAAADTLGDWMSGRMPQLDFSQVQLKAGMATRAASASVLSYLAEHVGNMIVSSADLASSDKTDGFLKKTKSFSYQDFSGAFLQSGVAELTMACIINGIALHGGLRGACATFFVFSDYMKPALRMAALMELPVIYIYSHDSFRVGEDGPTHEPVEQEAQMRLLEELRNLHGRRSVLVLRPADSAETVEAYRMALANSDTPTVLIFSRQDIADLPGADRRIKAAQAERGGYVVFGGESKPDGVLVGNGSDVSLLCEVAEKLKADDGLNLRVVSFPSIGRFLDQDKAYRDATIPDGVKIFGLTSGLPSTLQPLMKGEYEIYGLDHFGASAPAKVLDEKFGYTLDNIASKVRAFLGK